MSAIRHQHNGHAEATIWVAGPETEEPVYMGCFARVLGEASEVTEKRWNAFAEAMWRWGLEPIEDEPHFTVVTEDVVYDHYVLHVVVAQDVEVPEQVGYVE